MYTRFVVPLGLAAAFTALSIITPAADAGSQFGPRSVGSSADSSARRGRSPGRGVLSQRHMPLFWEGRVGPEDAPTGGEPVECATVPCDHFRLKIDLPFGTFQNQNRPGGVQVALRWFGNPAGHTL